MTRFLHHHGIRTPNQLTRSYVPIPRESILPFSSIILESFDTHTPVLDCAQALKQAGLKLNDRIDLAKESEFLETVKGIAVEAAWVGNENVRQSEFAFDFLLIMNGRKELNRRAFVELLAGIDAVAQKDIKATKAVKEALKAVLQYIKEKYPDVLTWLPLSYLQAISSLRIR